MDKTILTLQLPEYLVRTLRGYSKTGDIDVNKFVADSILNHSEDVSTHLSLAEVNCKYPENTLPLVVQIPKTQAFELGWSEVVRHLSISDIVTDVLSHSLPVLISELQAQEDYMVEVALTK